jgi:alkylation response protein AidB-like acyl-CoA dehydrogenase
MDPEQDMFAESLAGWLDRIAPSATVRGWLESGDPAAFESSLVAEGWLAVGTPEEAGGQGGGLIELAIAAEQFARRAAPSSAWLASVLALPALGEHGAAVIEDGAFAAILASTSGPLDAPAIVTADGQQLSGTVPLVLGADRATTLVVPTPDGLFLVEAADPAVTIEPRDLLDRSRSAADVTLDAAPGIRLEVDAEAVLAQAALRAAVLTAADSLGAASRMLELAVEYSKQRSQYGQLIGSFQAMKHAAATMLVEEEASRSIVFYAAATVDSGEPDAALHAATAKAQVTAAGARTADGSLGMHGAIGYTWEHDLQLLYKRAKLDVALFGSPGAWNERIATALQLV